jgi:hypothetical protein
MAADREGGLGESGTKRRQFSVYLFGGVIERQLVLESERSSVESLPIACTLTPDTLRVRKEGLLADLLRRAQGREDTPEGLRLTFAPSRDTIAGITQAVDAERLCCRFLRVTITVEPDGGAVILELSGPPGTGEFLSALLDS